MQVFNNIVKPALESCSSHRQEQPISQEIFLEEFCEFLKNVAQHLKDQPAIVAHTENTFDGSGIKRLLSNKFELEKVGCSLLIYLFFKFPVDELKSNWVHF